ncbi:uncharacterized protein TNCV_492261 [Trichonephila clavipes]|nr:uncharacterized protein TNCV_492261 [Trichonephila clavipes]
MEWSWLACGRRPYGSSVFSKVFHLCDHYCNERAVGSQVVRASDSRMPPNILREHPEYVLVKSVGPKFLWAESRVQGTVEYLPPLQFHTKIVEVEIGGFAIYRPFGEFHRANSYRHLYGAQGLGQRQAYF